MLSIGILPWPILIWVITTIFLIKVTLELDDVNIYLINCGSSKNTTIGNRVFLSDDFYSNELSTPQNVSVNMGSNYTLSSYDGVLFQTARVFNGISQYSFSIKKHGRYWIRLYFFPFSDGNYDLKNAKFSVSAQDFSLLRDYQPHNVSSVKEYSVQITSDKLDLTFTPSSDSFSFLNALEIVLIPDKVIPDGSLTLDLQPQYQNILNQALETVARVNMGDMAITRQNDTLWREWVSDRNFLSNVNIVKFISNIGAVNYSSSSDSEDIAPSFVYGTATKLNSISEPQFKANITWSYRIDPGFQYLVRFHFCDIVSNSPKQLYFNVYINSWLVVQNLDLSNQTSNILGTPYYKDVVTSSIDKAYLSISIGPSNVGDPYPDGILNGLEIMKLSDSEKSLVTSNSEKKPKETNWVIIGIFMAIGVLIVAVILALVIFLMCRKNKKTSYAGDSAENPVAVNENITFTVSKIGYRIPLAAIKEATDNFSESNIIGVGGFGKVYKGFLRDRTKAAVKRGTPKNRQVLSEFRTEIEMLSQFRHRHLVSLLGYCDEKNEMIIIYEYMDNGSLKNHLYGSDSSSMSWRKRLEICIGSAKGLHYLHTGSNKAIIHRDVKSANILLDGNFSAKVADFGISKMGPGIEETHVSTAVKGSFGYLDPEYLARKKLTEKSDVYSFGVVMFEILCGRAVIDPSLPKEEVNLIEWALDFEKRGELEKIIDPCLKNEIKIESLQKFAETAVKCLAESGVDRPTIGDVLWNLEYALQLQGSNERAVGENNNTSEFETSIVSSMASMGDLAEVSLSRVFSQMVKADNKSTEY